MLGKIIEDIFNYLLEHTKVDIPPVMIDNRVSQIKEDFKNALKSQKISKETYLKSLNITEEKLEEEIKELKRHIQNIQNQNQVQLEIIKSLNNLGEKWFDMITVLSGVQLKKDRREYPTERVGAKDTIIDIIEENSPEIVEQEVKEG